MLDKIADVKQQPHYFYLDCDCGQLEHTVRFEFIDWASDEELDLSISHILVDHDLFWKRFKNGIKYILFGNEILISDSIHDKSKVSELIKWLEKDGEFND